MSSVDKWKHPAPARRLMLYTVAVVFLVNLFVVTFGLFFLAQNKQKYEKNAVTQSQNLAHMLEYSMAGLLDAADLALLSVADEAESQLAHGGIAPARLNAFMARQHSRLPALDSLRLADADGNIAFGTGVGPGPKKRVVDREYFLRLRSDVEAGLVISRPVLGHISGQWVVILARRINAPGGSFAGVVYCAIQVEQIRNMLRAIDVGPHGRITLRDAAFGLMVRHPQPADFAAAIGKAPEAPEVRAALTRGMDWDTMQIPFGADGRRMLLTYHRVGRYPLYVTVVLASEDFLAPWHADVLKTSALVTLFVVVTLTLSRIIYVRSRRQLEAETELQASKEELELRVHERTEQLRHANDQLKEELSERARVEEKLRQGRNMLAQIIDTIPQFVFWKDRDSLYLGCNVQFARAAGIDHPDDIQGKSDYDLPWLPEETDAYRSDDRSVMEGNSAKFHIIERQLQAGGRRIWVDTTKVPLRNERGEVVGVLGVYEDVSERKAVEESRNRALALVESLLEASPTGIAVYEGESGNCVMANRAVAEIAGAAAEQLLRENFYEIPSWRESGLTETARKVLLDGETRSLQVSVASFGRTVEADCFLSRFQVEGENHLMFIAVDISEKKRLEQEKRLMEAQMLHVQKLESLGVLAGGIAHDFNNILMVVLGNADLALSRLDEEAPERENLVQIEQAASRAAELAQQMLSYSGKGNFVIENLDVNAVVADMAQMLEISISKKAALTYDFAPDLPAVSGDATQLRQVVLNLVINASEALGENSGEIRIRTGCLDCDRAYLSEIWIGDALPEGPYLVLEVSDTGCGIDPDIVPKIFDPFFTTKFTGRGLGMAAVLGIVRSHRGAIKVYSEKGRGTAFRVLLPCLPGTASLQKCVLPGEIWHGSGTVLLADDEPNIRSLGRDMLTSLGFEVVTACNGREAVELFRSLGGEVACVLLDLTMPELDGEQAFHELRLIDPGVKVIVSSGYSENEVSRKLAGHGGCGFIQKPYKLAEMSCKLKELLQP